MPSTEFGCYDGPAVFVPFFGTSSSTSNNPNVPFVFFLQINGVDVHSREQAIRLFAENREDITLLLARPQMVSIDTYVTRTMGNSEKGRLN